MPVRTDQFIPRGRRLPNSSPWSRTAAVVRSMTSPGSITERVMRGASCSGLVVGAAGSRMAARAQKPASTTPCSGHRPFVEFVEDACCCPGCCERIQCLARTAAFGRAGPCRPGRGCRSPAAGTAAADAGAVSPPGRMRVGGREAEAETTRGASRRSCHPVCHESESDLFIPATGGRTGLRRAGIGSVAEGVVRHAHCPMPVMHGKSR